MRIGHGYDVHRLVEGRRLILGGVEVPFDKGLLGHSDADVLTHAVMDALLGACALGDIGHLFPDSDPAYAGADSLRLLDEVVSRLRQRGYRVGNVDATVLAQAPKLAPYLEPMRRNLAWRLQVPVDAVSVKATTEEGLGLPARETALPPMPSAWWRTFCNRRTRRSSGAYTALRGAFLYGLLSHCLPFPDLRPADGLRSGAGGHYGPHPPLAKDDFRGGV